jgi:hypothetical protein
MLHLYELIVHEVSVDKTILDKDSVYEMIVDEMSVDKMIVGKMYMDIKKMPFI